MSSCHLYHSGFGAPAVSCVLFEGERARAWTSSVSMKGLAGHCKGAPASLWRPVPMKTLASSSKDPSGFSESLMCPSEDLALFLWGPPLFLWNVWLVLLKGLACRWRARLLPLRRARLSEECKLRVFPWGTWLIVLENLSEDPDSSRGRIWVTTRILIRSSKETNLRIWIGWRVTQESWLSFLKGLNQGSSVWFVVRRYLLLPCEFSDLLLWRTGFILLKSSAGPCDYPGSSLWIGWIVMKSFGRPYKDSDSFFVEMWLSVTKLLWELQTLRVPVNAHFKTAAYI